MFVCLKRWWTKLDFLLKTLWGHAASGYMTWHIRWTYHFNISIAFDDLGSISPTFYEHISRMQIPNAKRHWWLDCLLTLLGSVHVNAAPKLVGEIDLGRCAVCVNIWDVPWMYFREYAIIKKTHILRRNFWNCSLSFKLPRFMIVQSFLVS